MKTLTLTERHAVVRRLPRPDLDDLLGNFRGVVEATPTFTRGLYRLVARGYTGTFRTTSLRWELIPKLPWAAIRWMASGHDGVSGNGPSPDWGVAMANLLADRLAGLIRERTAAGLHCDYVEQHTVGPTVRGRIDLPRQLRGALPEGLRFHLVDSEFTSDVVWNRLPNAAARRLLAVPGLAADVRQRLANAISPLDGVSNLEASPADFARLQYDARTEPYRPVIHLARLVLGQQSPADDGSLLVNLEYLFQQHVGEVLSRPRALPAAWRADPQIPLVLTPDSPRLASLTLRPDLVVRDADGPRSVWDAKWKPLAAAGPHPDDVHQALGYAAALGVKAAGLVYPGRRHLAVAYRPTGSDVTLHVVRLRLVGPPEACEQSARWLSRRARA